MATQRIDDDEKLIQKLFVSGQDRNVTTINESGLYSLVLTSNKPEAKAFKKWITSEVLPSIRKNGGYLAPQVDFSDPDVMLNLLNQWKVDREKLIEANNKIEQQKPKVLFADAVESSVDSILIRDLAKIVKQNGVDIGEKRLFQWMRDNGYILTTSNKPSQKSMDLGVLELIEGLRLGSEQKFKPTFTTKCTGKGQIYFVKKLIEEKNSCI